VRHSRHAHLSLAARRLHPAGVAVAWLGLQLADHEAGDRRHSATDFRGDCIVLASLGLFAIARFSGQSLTGSRPAVGRN
jgi:hypothetical protein